MHGLAVVSRAGKVGVGEEDNQPAQGVFVYGIAGFNLVPTGLLRHPEHIVGSVVVAVFQFGC